MKKFGKTVGTALILGALLGALSGCQKKEGPAEQAGKVVDQTVEKVGQQVEKAGESIQDAAKGDSKK
jgi:hypothetical protein